MRFLGADFVLCLSEISAKFDVMLSTLKKTKLYGLFLWMGFNCLSVANKYYSSAGHHEQKNKETTGQVRFLLVTIRQQIKLVLRYSLCK